MQNKLVIAALLGSVSAFDLSDPKPCTDNACTGTDVACVKFTTTDPGEDAKGLEAAWAANNEDFTWLKALDQSPDDTVATVTAAAGWCLPAVDEAAKLCGTTIEGTKLSVACNPMPTKADDGKDTNTTTQQTTTTQQDQGNNTNTQQDQGNTTNTQQAQGNTTTTATTQNNTTTATASNTTASNQTASNQTASNQTASNGTTTTTNNTSTVVVNATNSTTPSTTPTGNTTTGAGATTTPAKKEQTGDVGVIEKGGKCDHKKEKMGCVEKHCCAIGTKLVKNASGADPTDAEKKEAEADMEKDKESGEGICLEDDKTEFEPGNGMKIEYECGATTLAASAMLVLSALVSM